MNEALLAWFWKEKRDLPWRKTKDPYSIWVSEIMLQQTQVNTVIPYYQRFLQRFPTIKTLAKVDEDEVLSLWKGLGYYTRARNLWRGAQYVMENFNGVVPQDYVDLRRIPGIGEYTAGAIASIAFGVKVAAIDGNVKRVVSRILGWTQPVETAQSHKTFLKKLEQWQSEENPGDFNQALMELGAMICTPKAPQCANCPIVKQCEAYRLDDVLRFPVKRQKNGPKVVTRLTFVLRKEGQVYLQQRPDRGLLARLWEFPGIEMVEESEEGKDIGEEKIEDVSWNGQADWGKLRKVTSEQWFEFYRKSVRNRTYDEEAQLIIRQRFKLSGPLWYTFSHRRWQIYWALIDLDEFDRVDKDYRNSLNINEKVIKYQGVKELPHNYEVNEERWVNLKDLDKETLPVAFKEIVDVLRSKLNSKLNS